jgi:Holliday junction DNA helicase RuvA
MIGKLKGTIDEINQDSLILDVGGVGYRVHCVSSVLEQSKLGEALHLWIETQMSEHALTLYGFTSKAQRAWFLLLNGVHGVGYKAALSLLGFASLENLAAIITQEDAVALSKAQGIGKKLAERIVNELKNKIPEGSGNNIVPLHAGLSGAISALVNLGYAENIARNTVNRVTTANENQPIEETIRICLKELAR